MVRGLRRRLDLLRRCQLSVMELNQGKGPKSRAAACASLLIPCILQLFFFPSLLTTHQAHAYHELASSKSYRCPLQLAASFHAAADLPHCLGRHWLGHSSITERQPTEPCMFLIRFRPSATKYKRTGEILLMQTYTAVVTEKEKKGRQLERRRIQLSRCS